jgi:hypothetical protein
MKARFNMKCLALILTLCLCISVPCHALTFFQADYDADAYTTETVHEGDWLPLRELSSILPYTVEWKDSTIYIYAERTWEIKPDWYLPEGVMIVDGVTYVSPRYMRRFLADRAFLYAGELYVFRGEAKRSLLVRGDEAFRRNALTALYRIKLALPEDYRLIRDCLTGGIEQGEWREWMPVGALAYVHPGQQRPTAYIVANLRWADLAELIAHEAHHVWEYYHGGVDEKAAKKYGEKVKAGVKE